MSNYAPVGGRFFTPFTAFLAMLCGIAGVLLVIRFVYGIGAVANINDGYTWGIWVVWDVVIGTGLACGGYAMAFMVYILNKGQYHPLVRPALLASLFGYSLGGFAVMVDLGRWWNFWHILSPSYYHVDSVMFEVAVCIALYVLVLWIEFAPVFLEKFGIEGLRKKLDKVLFIFIGLGVLLPSMHQSSLGSMLIIIGNQLDDRWQTIMLPVLFLISAFSMGFAVVIFEATSAAEGFRRPRETPLLAKLSISMVVVLCVFMGVRVIDLAVRGKIGHVFSFDFLGIMFWLEMVLFALPVVLLISAQGRQNARVLFVSSVSMITAAALYRIDAFLVAYNPGVEFTYFPSVSEIMITIGMIAFEILAYIVLARYLPVLHKPHEKEGLAVPAE